MPHKCLDCSSERRDIVGDLRHKVGGRECQRRGRVFGLKPGLIFDDENSCGHLERARKSYWRSGSKLRRLIEKGECGVTGEDWMEESRDD
jgi:hypothetical protein